MSPRIHPDTVEAVRSQVDIVDVISEHVVLRSRGKELWGLCPFHEDKKPSFSVTSSKDFYYCFSCGAGGNAIKFLMEIGKKDFAEVVLDLAAKYKIPVQTANPDQQQAFERKQSHQSQLYEVLAIASRFFQFHLLQAEGKEALTYLRQRRLKEEVVQQFEFGYAPAKREALYHHLVRVKGFSEDIVIQAGLIGKSKDDNSVYDRFRDRLMVPIRDRMSRIVGFGGRALRAGREPKYLNSPEGDLFAKSRLLFGLDRARAAIAKEDMAIVVEGYFDVVALHAAGIENVVGSMGTALSTDQVKALLRYTESKRIVLNFDADKAGLAATERIAGDLTNLAFQGLAQLKILSLPDGKDPDGFLQTHSADQYRERLKQSPPLLEWQVSHMVQGVDRDDPAGFQKVVRGVVQLIGKLPSAPLRTYYTHRCAELLGDGNSTFTLQLERDLRQMIEGERWHGRGKQWQQPSDRTLLQEAETQLLNLFLHSPDSRPKVIAALQETGLEFGVPQYRLLWSQIKSAQKAIGLDSPKLLSYLQDCNSESGDDNLSHVYHLFQPRTVQLRVAEGAEVFVIASTLACMERVACERRLRHYLALWEQCDWDNDPEGSVNEAIEYEKQIYAERQRIAELDRRRRSNSS